MRLFHPAKKVQVRENHKGEPIAFAYNGKLERIRQIGKRWRVNESWWRKEVAREYFQIETDTGFIYDIYYDLLTKSWYLQRIYD